MRDEDIKSIVYYSDEHTKTVTISGQSLKALFIPETLMNDISTETTLEVQNKLVCFADDLPSDITENDVVVVDGKTYYVYGVYAPPYSPVEIYLSKVRNYE